MLQTFRRASDNSLIVEFKANVELGQVAGEDDAPIRYTVHRTLDGSQIELRDDPPVVVSGDRQITLNVPLITAAALATVRGMRLGVEGLPVLWANSLTPSLPVLVVEILSKPYPGRGGTLNQSFRARIVLQPVR